ncbi:MAG: hypothetical protein COY40_04995 [Alphaproteobacteria bacterium CG_4_10_14_0_8_um_filter_53_9]|nr:MAG: hypothetical protein COY40_04995 [Alphaproteobacteria bacterium CG_4_10_14_0_8_um_filter_53_9]
MTITAKEYNVLNAIAHHEMNSINGDTPTQASEVQTYLWADDFGGEMQLNEHAVGGVIASLIEKKLIEVGEWDEKDNYVNFTDLGFDEWSAVHLCDELKTAEPATPAITKCHTALARGLNGKESVHCRQAYSDSRTPAQKKAQQQLIDAALKTKTTGKATGDTITALVAANPRKPGTHGHTSFEIILKAGGSIALADYKAAGGRMNDLRWDIERGNSQLA